MNKAKAQEKIQKIEAELKVLKRSVSDQPNFSVDKKNWQKVEKTAKNIRKENYKTEYGAE